MFDARLSLLTSGPEAQILLCQHSHDISTQMHRTMCEPEEYNLGFAHRDHPRVLGPDVPQMLLQGFPMVLRTSFKYLVAR